MASCSTIIEKAGGGTSYVCDLEGGHEGPHMAHGDERSLRERAAWVAEQNQQQQNAAQVLAQTQGPAQTTAERYTENPTDHPAIVREQELSGDCSFCREGDHLSCVKVKAILNNGPDVAACMCFERDRGIHGPDLHPPHSMGEVPVTQSTPPAQPPIEQATPEPTKQREGDQVLPRQTREKSVQERAIEKSRMLMERGDMSPHEFAAIERTMLESIRVGTERYGTPLQTFNGRNTLQDAEDEARDLFVYLSSLNQAAQASRDQIVGLCKDAVIEANTTGQQMDLQRVIEIVVDTIMGAVGPISNLRG